MNIFCPMNIPCKLIFPSDDEKKLLKDNYDLRLENGRLREVMIENGLETAASILATGQKQ